MIKKAILTAFTLLGCGSFIVASAVQMDIMKQNPVMFGACIVACLISAIGAINIVNK